MKNNLTLDQKLDAIIYEHEQRVKWFVRGIGIHCISPKLFSKMSTERIVELYNIEIVKI